MQKVKEYLDKEKLFTDLIPDLSKNVQKTVEKTSEILKDFIISDSNKPLAADFEKLSNHISRISKLQISVIKTLNSGNHSFDLTEFENITQSIINSTWSELHPYTEKFFTHIKSSIIISLCNTFKTLLKLFGSSALHPKVFKICQLLNRSLSPCKSVSKLLYSFLEATGSPGVDLISDYLKKNEIVSKVVKNLQVMACQEKITLGLCKKNSKKTIGNGHQTRHRKVVMKKTQNKLLKQVELDEKHEFDIQELTSWVSLINLYLESGPLEDLELEPVFLLHVDRLPEVLKYLLVEMMFNYSVLYKKHMKRLRNLLEDLAKDVEFRRTSRHYLFILGQIVRIS